MNALAQHIDINVGMDFDIAIERLQRDAGNKMSAYARLKAEPSAAASSIEDAKQAAAAAVVRQKSLRRHDQAAIREVLEDRSL